MIDHSLKMSGMRVRENELCTPTGSLSSLLKSRNKACFLYTQEAIRSRIHLLRSALPETVSLHYAIKANPNPLVIKAFQGLVDGLDVASAHELQMALSTGCRPEDVSFAGPGKRYEELEQCIAAGSLLVIESSTELLRAGEIASRTGHRPRVALRVNPAFSVAGSSMRMGGGPQPFGFDEELIPGIIASVARTPLDLVGFHIFAGSQNLNAQIIADYQKATLHLAIRLQEHLEKPMRWLNIGGGFGIPYHKGQDPLDVAEVGARLQSELDATQSQLSETEIILELGRYLVGEAGIYSAKILDKKISRGRTYLIVEGGLNHHLAATGNFGQVIRRDYPICLAEAVEPNESRPMEMVSIVGPLCTPLDKLGENIELPSPQIGEHIVVFASGAYGFSASPHQFLSHPEPDEILI